MAGRAGAAAPGGLTSPAAHPRSPGQSLAIALRGRRNRLRRVERLRWRRTPGERVMSIR
ncbi:hypothetical protein SCATT_p08620 (plasmid) [Streptantibioticus cattleyicolor NRRL 8057 = DSM 46488]|uniref:Uncharacterized protein n=1 Tax=Streptantibioticus cattleyicolor (strain ATCC 35852 / DSM 46488 / JCM 4925 / NBRC 14057 / NRRL 8057) TaxID=1003195 RepID=G8XDA7_STREN|nr:hypothetical protein SCATT_p08620 [Streptantibioticus cattleyicolor NRRL 8057 = DSM 46488]